jgi:hypothetical protein
MSAVEVTKKKKGKGNDGINNRLQIVMRSGKYSLGECARARTRPIHPSPFARDGRPTPRSARSPTSTPRRSD